MSNLEIKGTIKKIGDIETFPSGFQKRLVIVSTQEMYPQDLPIEFLQDKIDLPDAHKVGAEVTVGINLKSRTWTDPQGVEKYFPNIIGWKIIANTTAEPAKTKQEASTEIVTGKTKVPTATAEQAFGGEEDEDDDLPF